MNRVSAPIFVATVLSITCSLGGLPSARAEEPKKPDDHAAREDDMFGAGPAETSTKSAAGAEKAGSGHGAKTGDGAKSGEGSSPRDGAGNPEADLFGGQGGGLKTDAQVSGVLQEANDKLQVGGLMYLRGEWDIAEHGDLGSDALRSPNLLDVYLDARPNDRLRAYARARLNFDPTLSSSAQTTGETTPVGSSTFGFSQEPLEVLLDQLWLKTDIERTVFITVGRQRIKWGSGRTWNPTDFLNRQRKNPLDIFDVRTGVSLVKVHVPIEKLGWNFYAIGTLDDASSPSQVGGAIRGEFLIAETEIALTGAFKKNNPQRLGIDVSSAIGDFDVHVETALLHKVTSPFYEGTFSLPANGLRSLDDLSMIRIPTTVSRKGDWIPQISAGAEISLKYSDNDSVTFGAEYFFNDAGYSDESLYPWLIFNGQFTPFYLGRHYVSLFALLQAPGSWDNTTFILSGVSNLSDGSVVTRLDYQVLLLRYLRLNAFGMWHTGSLGELRFGLDLPGQCGNDAKGQIACPETSPVAGVPVSALSSGISTSPPLFEVGMGLRLDM